MAVNYELPPWLRPVDTAGPMVSGMSMGIRIAEERNRLAQQAQMAQMEMAVKQADAQRRALREQQEMEMEKQRIQIEQSLKKTALDQAQEKINFMVQKAAQRTAAQARYRDLINSGEDPAKALLQIGPDLGVSMTGAAQLYKSTMPKPEMGPPEQVNFGGEPFLKVPHPNGGFSYQQIHPTKKPGDMPSAIQSVPVLDPSGKPYPGMAGVPTGTGGYTVRNIPNRQLQVAQARLKSLEDSKQNEFAPYLVSDREPKQREDEKNDAFAARLARFKKVKAEYDKVKGFVDGAIDQLETGKGKLAVPHPDDTILYKRDGSKWIVKNGVPVPYTEQQVSVSPPHDEEAAPAPDEEEDLTGDGQ